MSGVWAMRVAILVVAIVIGVWLLARGNTVFGGVILVMAAMRAVLLFMVYRRRQNFRARFPGRFGQ